MSEAAKADRPLPVLSSEGLGPARDAALRELDDATNQTWRGKRARWAALVRAQDAEIQRLRTALAKIADWDSNWGPFPENNDAWRAMVVVTAREAVPELGPNVAGNRIDPACRGNSG